MDKKPLIKGLKVVGNILEISIKYNGRRRNEERKTCSG